MSIDRGKDKEDVVHIYHGILLSHKKEWNNAICCNIDGHRECHTEWSKSDREGEISWYPLYMESKKKWYKETCLQNRNRLTDFKNKFLVARGKDGGKG